MIVVMEREREREREREIIELGSITGAAKATRLAIK